MTEDEAKKKWCPMVRTGLVAGMAVNHHIGGDVDDCNRCIGSGCMMWRWDNYRTGWHKSGAIVADGFCGLAGTVSA